MNAIKLLRRMHADTKVRFKVILGSQDAASAAEQWQALQPLLDLHEQLEDEFVYTPLFEEMGPGTPLGNWDSQHEADVTIVKQLIQDTSQFDPATPEWRMSIATVMDTVSKHVMDEEGQIFGRIEQVWGPERLEQAGAGMQKVLDKATRGGKTAATTASKAPRARTTARAEPASTRASGRRS